MKPSILTHKLVVIWLWGPHWILNKALWNVRIDCTPAHWKEKEKICIETIVWKLIMDLRQQRSDDGFVSGNRATQERPEQLVRSDTKLWKLPTLLPSNVLQHLNCCHSSTFYDTLLPQSYILRHIVATVLTAVKMVKIARIVGFNVSGWAEPTVKIASEMWKCLWLPLKNELAHNHQDCMQHRISKEREAASWTIEQKLTWPKKNTTPEFDSDFPEPAIDWIEIVACKPFYKRCGLVLSLGHTCDQFWHLTVNFRKSPHMAWIWDNSVEESLLLVWMLEAFSWVEPDDVSLSKLETTFDVWRATASLAPENPKFGSFDKFPAKPVLHCGTAVVQQPFHLVNNRSHFDSCTEFNCFHWKSLLSNLRMCSRCQGGN